MSIRELSAKYPSLPLVLDIALVQPLSNIHNQSEDLNKDFWKLTALRCFKAPVVYLESDNDHAELRLLYQFMHQSPCSWFSHSWTPHQSTWTSWHTAVYCRLLAAGTGVRFWLDMMTRLYSANFHSGLVFSRSWKQIKSMLNNLFRRCKQYPILRKKQTVDPATSNSGDLVDSVATIYPIHIDLNRSDSAHPVGVQHPLGTVVI